MNIESVDENKKFNLEDVVRNIIKYINESDEGLAINENKIRIGEKTKFNPGYDIAEKLKRIGGRYKSSLGRARVEFSDDNNIDLYEDTHKSGNDVVGDKAEIKFIRSSDVTKQFVLRKRCGSVYENDNVLELYSTEPAADRFNVIFLGRIGDKNIVDNNCIAISCNIDTSKNRNLLNGMFQVIMATNRVMPSNTIHICAADARQLFENDNKSGIGTYIMGSGTDGFGGIGHASIGITLYQTNSSHLSLGASLIPDLNAEYDIGSSNFKLRNIHIDGTVDGIDISANINQSVKTDASPIFAGLGINGYIGSSLIPASSLYALGLTNYRWGLVYTNAIDVANNIVVGGTVDGVDVSSHTHSGSGQGGTVSHSWLGEVTADQHHVRSHDHSVSSDGAALAPTSLRVFSGGTTYIDIGYTNLHDILPRGNNYGRVGYPDRKWDKMYANQFNTSDIYFENNWCFTESYKVGINKNGLALLDNENKLKLFIGNDGVYIQGGNIKNLDELLYIITTPEQRARMCKDEKTADERSIKIPDLSLSKTNGGEFTPIKVL